MTVYTGDQPNIGMMVANGIMSVATAAALKAISPASTIYTFTANFTHVFNGAHLNFRAGESYYLDASLKAALLAASAPMVAA